MCGISGVLQLAPGADEATIKSRLHRQIDAISHRGPDDRGTWTDGTCGLGHARLAIIDLSPAGHQPMTTTDSKYWIVFNGEIYNFHEIRAELEAKGCTFRSNSDTECILEGYRVWGDAVLDRLRGMFALALWDPGRQRLLLARDRLGKKPLYWGRIGNSIVFGSELKSFPPFRYVPKAIPRTFVETASRRFVSSLSRPCAVIHTTWTSVLPTKVPYQM